MYVFFCFFFYSSTSLIIQYSLMTMHSYFTSGELVENLYEFVQSYLYVLMIFILPTNRMFESDPMNSYESAHSLFVTF